MAQGRAERLGAEVIMVGRHRAAESRALTVPPTDVGGKEGVQIETESSDYEGVLPHSSALGPAWLPAIRANL